MAQILQPADWYEHDNNGKYVIDVFGRIDKTRVACVRITGFKPFFYSSGAKPSNGVAMNKYDVFAGFNDLAKTAVWKVESDSKKAFRDAIKSAKGQLYETNLPPFLRMFHERHIGPASPISFKANNRRKIPQSEAGEDLYNVDEFYECDYKDVSVADANIPLLVACYDLEMYSKSGLFPRAANNDPIVQIGVSYRWSDDMLTPVGKTVFVVGSVSPSTEPGTTFVACKTEESALLQFHSQIQAKNPDVMCGYNTFGFDDAYIEDRCRYLDILDMMNFSRCPPMNTKDSNDNWVPKFSEVKKFELAAGKFDLRYLTMTGRLGIDLLLNMRREHSLDTFKLDNVASVFLRDKVLEYSKGVVKTKSTRGLRNGNYIKFDVVGNTSDPYREGHKFLVSNVQKSSFEIDVDDTLFTDLSDKDRKCLEWTFTKDDVEPAELFRLCQGSADDRARIARYCIQDCDLVLTLMAKLDTIVNARGMADVCKVPMQFVLTRGQGIKIFSAVVYYASQRDQIIRTQEAFGGDYSYEGAIVLPPVIGMYLDQPISVLDFNSLYPTNMISYNLSPDTLVSVKEYDTDGNLLGDKAFNQRTRDRVEALREKYVLDEVDYDTRDDKDVIIGKMRCIFAQPIAGNEMTTGILPKTLAILLKKRKEFKEKMEDTQYDEAQRSVFNGLQLAYKVVANSVYGQCGAKTSPIRSLYVAACTTAAGRKALGIAKSVVESEFEGKVIYGDTDSIFIKFPTKDVGESINLGIAAGKRITQQCGRSYKIAYEKTFYPFILFCRKRYCGMKYEEDPNPAKAKRMSMGIVLKRRDNAPIVKDVFGGALDILLLERNVKKAQEFTNRLLLDVLENRMPLEKFIVSKSLRDDYITAVPEDVQRHRSKEKHHSLNGEKASFHTIKAYTDQFGLSAPVSSIAHRVLADRMADRDPGTAPKVGDRVQYIYVAENKTKSKQGDRIENMDYVRAKKLTPDTEFYITNQIQNPVAQLFALCIEQLDGYVAPKKNSYATIYEMALVKNEGNEEEATLHVLKQKEKQLDSLMFLDSPVLSKIVRGNVRGPMDAFLKKK
jgi:DNA polymerase elongation subunit (family B)